MTVADAHRVTQPFLGLNYFDEDDAVLFFGRDEQLRDLLAKLTESRFVTVIGGSGSGKSSLVRAALIPALHAGFVLTAEPGWRIVKLAPGASPIRNLARALEQQLAASGVEVTLRRGPLGLIEAAHQCLLQRDENLLVFVDQFEEIFRYQRDAPDPRTAAAEAAAFVQLLLAAADNVKPRIYVVLTMRSEYLGPCARFRDLPERINRGLYLVPRMVRDQVEDAIVGPAAVVGARFAPSLVQRLLNDAGDDPDQLSILQHVLLRTWLEWKKLKQPDSDIALQHYTQTGGARDGLNKHAEELYKGLSASDQRIAKAIFTCLTERDPLNNDIRRPTPVNIISKISGVTPDDVIRVADVFRQEGVSFLKPSIDPRAPAKLDEHTQLDITHESLIRRWYRLGGVAPADEPGGKNWVQAEADLRDQYRDLLKRARAAETTGAKLTGGDLDAALEWRRQRPTPQWATRYEPDPEAFGLMARYIDRSRLRRRLWQGAVAAVCAGLAVLGGLLAQRTATAAAERELRGTAEQFRALATARLLVSQSDALKDRDSRPELSALLAIQALETLKPKPMPEAVQALRTAMNVLHRPLWARDGGDQPLKSEANEEEFSFFIEPGHLTFTGDGRHLALLGRDEALHVYDAATGVPATIARLPGRVKSVAKGPGNTLYVESIVKENSGTGVVDVFSVPLDGGAAKPVLPAACDESCHDGGLTRDGKGFWHYSLDERTNLRHFDNTQRLVPLNGEGELSTVWPQADLVIREIDPGDGPARLVFYTLKNVKLGEVRKDPTAQLVDISPKPVADVDEDNPSYIALSAQSAGGQRSIQIYKNEKGVELTGEVPMRVNPSALAISPNGRLLAIGDEEGDVRVVHWPTQQKRAAWSHGSDVIAVSFSPDGQSVASMDSSGAVRMIPLGSRPDARSDYVPLALDTRARGLVAVTFDLSDRYLIARRAPTFAQLFDAQTGDRVPVVEDAALQEASLLSVSPDGGYVAVYSRRARSVAVVDLKTGRPIFRDEERGLASSLAIGAGGRYLAMRGRDLRIIDVRSGVPITLPESLVSASAPVFSSDGRWMTVRLREDVPSTDPVRLALVNCESWKVVRDWEFNAQTVTPIFSPDSAFLFVRKVGGSSEQKNIERDHLFLDLKSLKEPNIGLPATASAITGAFSADSRTLAIATRNQREHGVEVLETTSGALRRHISLDLIPTALTISRGSKYLGVTLRNAGARIFDLATGTEVSRTAGADAGEQFVTMRFGQDERTVAIVVRTGAGYEEEEVGARSVSMAVRRQYILAEDLAREGCQIVGRPLTAEEWKKYLPEYPYTQAACVQIR